MEYIISLVKLIYLLFKKNMQQQKKIEWYYDLKYFYTILPAHPQEIFSYHYNNITNKSCYDHFSNHKVVSVRVYTDMQVLVYTDISFF